MAALRWRRGRQGGRRAPTMGRRRQPATWVAPRTVTRCLATWASRSRARCSTACSPGGSTALGPS
eukprot:7591680-Pyramimonas_sp.AAC.1